MMTIKGRLEWTDGTKSAVKWVDDPDGNYGRIESMIQEQFDKEIWPKLTNEEANELCMRHILGAHTYNRDGSVLIIQSKSALDHYNEYRNEMIKKYEHPSHKIS